MVAYLRSLLLLLVFCTTITSKLFAQQPDGTRGMHFSGSNFIQVPNNTSLNLTNNFTIEAWVKLSQIPGIGATQIIVSKRGTTPVGYQFSISDGGRLTLFAAGSFLASTAAGTISDVNRWYHVAVSYTNVANGTKFFVNGTLVEQLTNVTLPTVTTEPLRIGAENIGTGTSFFRGQMDGVRISNFVRYTTGFTPPTSPTADVNTVALYNFDEISGQVVTDQSTFNNSGILGTTASIEATDAIRAIRTINTGDTGAGSLRQAITDANASTDVNYLDFSIPNSAPWIINPASVLPIIDTKVILDGTSQFGWSGTSLIELNGSAITVAPPDANGIEINVNGAESEVYGMEIYGFTAGTFPSGIRTNAANLKIGASGKRNVLRNNGRGLYIFGSSAGTIASHNYIGLDKTGNIAQGNSIGVEVSFPNNIQILNNVVSANNQNIRVPTSNNTIIRGNFIGTNAAGTSAGFTQSIGIFIGGGGTNTTIGGSTPADANVIGGHTASAIQLFGGDNQTVRGNYIGTDLSGTVNLGNNIGVEIISSSIGNIIGGTLAGEGNTIAFNTTAINISNSGINNGRISGNAIYCNTTNAIRLEGAGSNNNKAAPTIATASTTAVSGTSVANDIIEIFRDNPTVCGFANQGRVYVTTVTADALGNWSYTGAFPAGSRITATATDAANNTSPFSIAFALPASYTTRGNAIWNTNGNWSLDDGVTDCSCNPAGQNNAIVIIRHNVTVTGAADIGTNNIIELQDNGELFLQAQPTNQIAEIRTSGAITSAANLRFGYLPVSNNVVALNNLDNTNPLVAVIFDSGDGTIPVRIGTEATPKPYPSVVITAGNKTMQFPAGVGNYFINGNFFMGGGSSLSFDAAVTGNTLEINGLITTVTGGATLNANDTEVKLLINNTLRNIGGTVNGTLSGLEFKDVLSASYQHDRDGGNIPLATWGLQSQCLVTGAANTMPGGWAGQSFGRLIWDCGNQNTFMAFNADFDVRGTFSVNQTRNPSFPLGLSVASLGSYIVKVNNFEMNTPPNTANFYPYGGTNAADIGTLEVTGNCTMLGGGTGVLSSIGTSRLSFTGTANSTLNYNASFSFSNNARWVLEVNKSAGASVNINGFAFFTPASGTPASFLRLTNGTFNIDNNQALIVSNIEGSSGTLQMSPNSQLYLEQHNIAFSNTFNGTVNLDPTSRIFYRSANEQRIFVPSSGNYTNLILDGLNNSTPVRKNIEGSIQIGSLNIVDNANLYFTGSNDVTVRVDGDLTNSIGESTITHNMVGYNHTLDLRGNVNQVDNFVVAGAGNTSHVIYARTDDQQVFASPNYVELTINGGGIKTLQGNSEVDYKLNLTNGRLQLGSFNLTYNGLPADLSAGSTGWIATNSSGKFIQGAAGGNLLFPIGSDVEYQPVRLVTAVAGSSARFGSSTPGLLMGSVGSWFIDNLTADTDILIENPQGGSLIWNVSEIGRYTTSWNTLTTAYPSTNVYRAFLPSTGTAQELAVIATAPVIPTQPVGNRGLYFDGIDDFITAPADPSINFAGNSPHTISLWVKVPAITAGNQFLIFKQSATAGTLQILTVITPDGKISFQHDRLGTDWDRRTTQNPVIVPNQWTHIALVSNGLADGKFIYINGVAQTTVIDAGTANVHLSAGASNGILSIGHSSFNGQIDEVRIYNTARTQPQIMADMSSTAPNSAIAFWRFEEGTGNMAANNGGAGASLNATLPPATQTPLWALRVKNTNDTGTESLRDVISTANTLTGKNYVDFSIAGAGLQVISSLTQLPDIADPVLIDGYSQNGSRANQLPVGNDAIINIALQDGSGGNASGLIVNTADAEIRGLNIRGFNGASPNNQGILIQGNDNIITGCFIGTDATGTNAAGNGIGISIIGNNNQIGGLSFGERNVISGNQWGIFISFNPTGNQILNNYIGTNRTGNGALPNTIDGIRLIGSNTIIGGNTAAHRNVISGNNTAGIAFLSGAFTLTDNTIYGNYIGLGADGTTALGNIAGVRFLSSDIQNTIIGGVLPGQANVIANNSGEAVSLTGNATNQIRGNNTYCNGSGIVSAVISEPVISTATPALVTGNTLPNAQVDIYRDNPLCGADQGREYLTTVTADATGNWSATYALNLSDRITATATNTANSTSPFSVAATVAPAIPTQPLSNRGLYFDGTDDAVVVPDNASLRPTTITVQAWIKPSRINTSPYNNVVAKESASAGYALRIGDGGRVDFGIFIDGTARFATTAAGLVQVNKWTHIAATYDGSVIRTYVNGVQEAATNITGSITHSTNVLNIGRNPNFTGREFEGQIDEVRIFNTARINSEIQADIGVTTPNGAVAYWNFEDDAAAGNQQTAVNTGTAGAAINGTLGTTATPDAADPLWALRVNNTLDDVNPGSLRWAISQAGTDTDTDYIDFSVGTGTQTIQVNSLLSAITNPLILDGTSKEDYALFSQMVQINNGAAVGFGLLFTGAGASNSVVKGLQITNFGMNAGITVDGANNLQITNNLISGNSNSNISIANANATIIRGNRIGTDLAGAAVLGTNVRGITLSIGANNTIIGGAGAGEGNLISGHAVGGTHDAIRIQGGNNSVIYGNLIGVNANRTAFIPNSTGIAIANGLNNIIGGLLPGQANIIAGNNLGIAYTSGTVLGNTYIGNQIFCNTSSQMTLSIGNNNQAPPVITAANTLGNVAGTGVAGDIIHLYKNPPPPCNAANVQEYLGTTTVTAGGTWTLSGLTLAFGDVIVGTQTNASNGSSGYSATFTVVPPIPTQPPGNRGVYFDGVDDVANLRPIPATTTATIQFWYKPLNDLPGTIFHNTGAAPNTGLWLERVTPTNLRLSFGRGGDRAMRNFPYSFATNQWYHIAIVYSHPNVTLFVNGTSAGAQSFTSPGAGSPTFNSTIPLYFGGQYAPAWADDTYIKMHIDEVRIFTTVRDASQIALDMASTLPNGAYSYFDFNEATGQLLNNQGTSALAGELGRTGTAEVFDPLWVLRVTNTDAAGTGSFRQVITDANTLPGQNYIDFSIPVTDPNYSSGVWTIQSSTGVPANVIDGSIIDGYSAFGSAPATTGTSATIAIQLQQPTSGSTLQLAGTQPTTVKGLSIAQSVSSGLAALWLSGSAGHVIQGNYIGINAVGNAAFPATTSSGIVIQGSSNNTIGGITPEARNVIGGALLSGIRIDGTSPTNNLILGNYIGLQADGTTPLANSNSGIIINSASALNNQIGNGAANGRNIIANSGLWGISITGGSSSISVRNNHIYGNITGGITLTAGSNNDKAAPVLTTFSPTLLSGTCEAGDIVEVFIDSPQTGTTNQGRQFVGLAAVTGTTWTLTGAFTAGTRYTATATDAAGNTSPFSAPLPFDFSTAQSGNWNDPATWVGGNVPPANSNITIVNSHIITADINVNINNLIIEPNATLNMGSFALATSAVTLGGTLDMGVGAHALSSITDNGGAGKLIVNDNATSALIGSLTGSFFDVAGNTVVFAGSGSYTLPVRNYPTLKVAGSGIRTIPTGSLIVISGHIINDGTGTELNINVAVTLPDAGLVPHLIQGTSGNIIRFNNNITVLGSTQVTGNFICEVNGLLNVTVTTFENQNPLFSIGTGGEITGSGTFRNLATVVYSSANTPSISTLDVATVPNRFIYANGTAAVAATSYDALIIRGSRSAGTGTINANTVEMDNAATATVWTLANGSSVVVSGDLILNNTNGATLDLGTGNAGVTIEGNLLGSAANSEIRSFPAAGNAQLLELKGSTNEIALYDASGDATVRYSGANQQVFGSFDYMFVEITGGGVKSLQNEVSINGQLRLLSGRLQLNNHNLTLANPIVANQLTGSFVNSWIQTNGSGRLIRQGAGTNVVFPVGDAAAARPVTIATTATGNTEATFTNTISPTVTAANIAAGMWSINSPAITTNLTFESVGGTANGTSEIYSSNSPWVLVPTQPTRPPYTTASPVAFSGTSQNFTVFSNACITPVISLVQDESAFLCSPTLGRITIRLQEISVTAGALYDIDLNGDGIWDRTNVLPLSTSILLADNLAAGTVISNPRVRVAGTSCVSAPAPLNLTISGKKPIILAAETTRPTSCATPDGKLLLRIRNGIINGLYHVDLNNDGINEFNNLRLQSDSTILVEGIAEKTPLPAIKVTYSINSCTSEALQLNQIMPDANRPAVNLAVTGETEADPAEIIAIRIQDIQAGVSYRLMRDTVQVGQPQSGTAGATLTFNTEPLVRNSVYKVFAKGIDSGCEVELEQTISIRVYHEVTDSLTLVALYNSANGANWQPGWNLRTPVRSWHGVSVRKGRVTSLNLNNKGLAGLINPVLQLPRLSVLNVANNRLEFDAFENVLPALASRGVTLAFSPQAPVNEELTITEFETKTVTLRTTARGTRNTYQWFKNNQPLAGAVAAELSLRNLTIQDAGVYYCEIRNPEAPGLTIQRRRITLNVLQYMRSQSDSLVLVELYRTLGGDSWIQRFDFRNPVATWPGIQTTNGRVTGINLANNNLTGEIPDIFIELRGLGILDDLEYLNLSNNKITGRIPESLTNHRKLTYLDLSFNLLEGEVPAYIGVFAELRTLWLSGNRFTRLPREIGQLSKLTNLLLDGNLLEQLPDEIGQLRNLQIFRVSGNRLRSLPPSIAGIFGNLKILGLADNSIESLPVAFESLPDGLEQLLLHNNRLSSVPLNVADRPRLQLLTIYGNRMDFSIIEPLMLRFRDRRSTAEVLYAPQAPIGTAGELTIQNGQALTLTIRTGGTANRYRWFKDNSPLSNDLNIADYTVARAQANDTGSYWVHVTNPNAPDLTLVSLITQVQVTCGTAATFTIRAQGNTELCGNEPFATVLQVTGMDNAAEIRWLRNGSLLAGVQGRNFTPQAAGRYRAMVRTEGANCFTVSSNEIDIQVLENISLALTVAQGGRLFAQVAGNPSVQRYEWFRNGQLIASTTSREFTAEQAGNYSVSLITSNGCRFTSAVVAVDNTIVGIEDWPTVVPLRLYPNPARNQLQLQSSLLKIEDCKVFNSLGQPVTVQVQKQLPDEWLLDISGLVPGAYLLRCRTHQGDVWMKWIKE